jgi:hypothetical protein
LENLRELNIKFDMPSAAEGMKRVREELRRSAVLGCTAVKLIHGYGSTGRGGRLRTETRKYLENEKRLGHICDYIPGERFSIFDEATRRAFLRCGSLRRDDDLERANNGVTIVVL